MKRFPMLGVALPAIVLCSLSGTRADPDATGGTVYAAQAGVTQSDEEGMLKPCGSPTGACCFGNGPCEVLTEEDCFGYGGAAWMAGETCRPNPCPFFLGDVNCDHSLDVNDVPYFVDALLGDYAGCDISLADMDLSGRVDGPDIEILVFVLMFPLP